MQIGWKLENCYRPNTPQQTQACDEDKQPSGANGDDDKVPATEPESPKKTITFKETSAAEQSKASAANEFPDGAIEQHPVCTLTVDSGSTTASQD